MEVLQIIWFALLGVLLASFLIFGGFDFGVGVLAGFSRNNETRDKAMKSIAPFWDGNQVWLVTAGGALFAAFPKAYSTILSNLYIPIILFLCLLIFRAVSIEFYLSLDGEKWRGFWAKICGLTSLLSLVVFGVALGALFNGSALSNSGESVALIRIFTPLSLCAGVLTAIFGIAQGAGYLALKNNTIETFASARIWVFVLAVCYLAYMGCFVVYGRINELPRLIPLGILLASYIPLSLAIKLLRKMMFKTSFALTSLFALLCVAGHSLAGFPYIVSPTQTSIGVDIYTASSSIKTLQIMLGVALVGVPIALSYFVYAHIVFADKRPQKKSE